MCTYEYISEDRVLELLSWDKIIESSECALKSVALGKAIQSPRIKFTLPYKNIVFANGGYLIDDKYGALAYRLFPKIFTNRQLSPPLPVLNATIKLLDEKTGLTKALIAGNALTEWRTAAVSLVATKYLCSTKQKNVLALVGAGAQGRIHAIAFQKFFKFQQVKIWNRTQKKTNDLADELNYQFGTNDFVVCNSVENCLKNADVVVCSTTGKQTVKCEWLKKGSHINAISVNNTDTDLDAASYKVSNVYCNYWDGAKNELKHIEAYGATFMGQVGDVIVGQLALPKAEETTIFQSLGMGVEDCAVARFIYDLHKTMLKTKL